MDDFKITHRLVLPIKIVTEKDIVAAVRFPRPKGYPLLPAKITAAVRSSKFSLKSEENYEEEERRMIEYKYYDMTVQSEGQEGLFRIKLPVEGGNTQEKHFELKIGKSEGTLRQIDECLEAYEEMEELSAAKLTFQQKMRIQESLIDARRRKLSQHDLQDEVEEDST